MPRIWEIELAAEPARPMGWRFDVLHAIACSVFEKPGDAHDAGDKAFTIRTEPRTITLTWLGASDPPHIRLPEQVPVGEEQIPVAQVRESILGYETIETSPIVSELDFTVSTPTLFRHNGHNYPLPDPYVALAGLARRYRTHRPDTDMDGDLVKELGRAVMVVRHRIKTEQFSWHGRTDSGFIGTFTYRLGAPASPRAQRAFTTLGTFTTVAGLGRGTTHGLGATTVTAPRTTNQSLRH